MGVTGSFKKGGLQQEFLLFSPTLELLLKPGVCHQKVRLCSDTGLFCDNEELQIPLLNMWLLFGKRAAIEFLHPSLPVNPSHLYYI